MTKQIFDILESTDADVEKFEIRKDILTTYNKIFDLGIEELVSELTNEKVIEITDEASINSFFDDLIED